MVWERRHPECPLRRTTNVPENHPDTFELHYLGPTVAGFEDIDSAKFNVPEFARSVFQILGEFIQEP